MMFNFFSYLFYRLFVNKQMKWLDSLTNSMDMNLSKL